MGQAYSALYPTQLFPRSMCSWTTPILKPAYRSKDRIEELFASLGTDARKQLAG